MKEVHKNIRHYRKLLKMTQEDLARAAGYTDRSSIAKIEKGQVELPQERIEVFARIFGVPPNVLTGWTEEKNRSLEYCVEQEMRLLGWEQYLDSEGNIALVHNNIFYECTSEDITDIEKRLIDYLQLILSDIELKGKRREEK